MEEQHAQKHERFRRGRQFAYLIYDHFRATRAYDAAPGLSDLLNNCSQGDDIQDFDTRWDQALLTASEIARVNVFEGLYKMKKRGSVQLQTVLVMYDPEMDRDRAMPSNQRLKTLARRHDQMIWTRNFSARNQRIETGVLVTSQKGRKVSVEGKVAECYQWKEKGQCSSGDSCSFSH